MAHKVAVHKNESHIRQRPPFSCLLNYNQNSRKELLQLSVYQMLCFFLWGVSLEVEDKIEM